MTSEHCWVNDPRSLPFTVTDLGGGSRATNQFSDSYVRYSQTRWRLQTGGRACRSSLFRLRATAALILDKRAERPFGQAKSLPILPEDITLAGEVLPADTNLWMVLPDGIDLDVTPAVVGADFYTMDVASQKYIPRVLVNSVSLDSTTPDFSAGEFLTFELIFDPPPEFVSQASLWNLPGQPLNESWQEGPTGSVNYRFNPNLLTNLVTSCWYPSGGDRSVMVTTVLQFTNGQYGILEPGGDFNISKPSFAAFDNCASLIGFTWDEPVLTANMQWGLTVQSQHDGNVGVAQLVSGTNGCYDTGGAFQLDGRTLTNLCGQGYSAMNLTTHTARFTYAQNAEANPSANLAATFRDYLRFMPAGNASNIWVTLATIEWSMDGSASLSGGIIRSNLPPAGGPVETDEIPAWGSCNGQ